jgi:6-phosphogluconolactonase (cycloisomerase 2 family)
MNLTRRTLLGLPAALVPIQKSNGIVTFQVDQTTGTLTQTSDFSTPTPVCVNV